MADRIPSLDDQMFNTAVFTSTIANGLTVGTEVYMGPFRPVAILLGAEYDGTAMSFQAGIATGATVPLIDGFDDAGAAISIVVAASKFIRLDPSFFAGVAYLKPVAGTAQTGASTVKIIGQIL